MQWSSRSHRDHIIWRRPILILPKWKRIFHSPTQQNTTAPSACHPDRAALLQLSTLSHIGILGNSEETTAQSHHAHTSLQSKSNTRKGPRQEMGFVHNTPAAGEIIHSYCLLSVLNTTALDTNDSKKGALALFCFSALFSFMCGQSFPVTMALMSATGTNSKKVKLPNKQS